MILNLIVLKLIQNFKIRKIDLDESSIPICLELLDELLISPNNILQTEVGKLVQVHICSNRKNAKKTLESQSSYRTVHSCKFCRRKTLRLELQRPISPCTYLLRRCEQALKFNLNTSHVWLFSLSVDGLPDNFSFSKKGSCFVQQSLKFIFYND